LSREEAARGVPVTVRGVVTWRDDQGQLTIQDASSGIWISLIEARANGDWGAEDGTFAEAREGMEVEVVGKSHPGGYATIILPQSIRIIGPKALPTAMPMQPNRFFSGSDDCHRVEVRGVVQGFLITAEEVMLSVDADPGRFTVQVRRTMIPDPASLVDSQLLLRGVAATLFNTRSEVLASRLLIGLPADLTVEVPPPAPEAVPRVSLGRLLPFRTEPLGPHRVRVEGVVTYALPGKFFYLQEGAVAVRVETNSTEKLKAGDRVEAAGFVKMSRRIGTLHDATVRRTGVAALPETVTTDPEDILEVNEQAIRKGVVPQPHDFDGHLIRCTARLLAVQQGGGGQPLRTLTLERKNGSGHNFTLRAHLYQGNCKLLDSLRPGSDLSVTGLVQLDYATGEPPSSFRGTPPVDFNLILRDESDVSIISEPSWWTSTRFKALLAAVLLALACALAWNLQLKRQVRRKTRLLAKEMRARRDAALEFRTTMRERNRLAANLHDTLPQTMNGIGLQLDACEFYIRQLGVQSLPALDVARRMVEFGMTELRGAVWEMRSLSLRGRDFRAALDSVVEQARSGHSAEIRVTVEGVSASVPEFVSGNLLLILQEALRNAQQHGKVSEIRVEVTACQSSGIIKLIVCDNGKGFDMERGNGPEQGHYGIVGMRERAECLGGSLEIRSSPGNGTEVIAKVSQHCNDEDFAELEDLADPPIA
jgi:signal transduction histidine kinase